ncbi:unnamed protein product [Rotaria sp. Silwood2]|nr:unnamed protein product [Rotaria sp. Silwood2]CAF2756666.1 unnamed protein product [Rotaria sp. Silwood2]CAF3080285.1 unnamed protein product [Rotaria sp. Silwood2]CAF3171526.1 unnamed protein product [Rotaria sp. Silwood2]CAF4163342.1 unnamed protein product [Rotaria sp. Silwood2]
MGFIECLRCARDCGFVAFPLNRPVPMNACQLAEQDNAQCSVIVTIDFKKRFVTGVLNIGNHVSIATLRMETKFQVESGSIMSTIWYTCAMSDYCDFEFLNELMTDKLANLNAISVQQKLIDLLYKSTPDPTDIQCTKELCPANSFCQADLQNTVTSQYNYTFINESLPCVHMSSNNSLLEISQRFSYSAFQVAAMTLLCNHKECNNNRTVEEAYALIRNEFTIPLNYSILSINRTSIITTTSLLSGGSFLVLSYGITIFFQLCFFFYFF